MGARMHRRDARIEGARMKVTDEMVERACRATGWEPWQARYAVRLALEAALLVLSGDVCE